ncbi:ADP-dependent glucokinase/phosphofructokinase [Sinomonas mesophila]|uniref:ADP-dependent glucokinase/phosphofructokinase n=1 Tax=Sinomonas mesophila TaxID=1531955 RepID=UPI0009868C33|nr:ADP-dependent glucokinase/phosphofructokinase [Sinomonas mesophila]
MTRRLVLGLGGSVDYEITWSSEVIEELAESYGVRADELGTSPPITDERSLVVSVLGYFVRGVGGEHHVASPDVLETFASRLPRKVTLGGTGVRAGLALARLGVPSTLHLVSVNEHFRRLLPQECSWVTSAEQDSIEPHLIVQWDSGARVRVGETELVAPFPNRLIYVNDPPNAEMRLSRDLPAALAEADIVLLSGLNAMQDERTLAARLDELRSALTSLPDEAFVYYEDAGFHWPAFSGLVRAALLDRIDVYGMNEDELQTHLAREVDLLDPVSVRRAVTDIAVVIPARTLVVHTKYWALAAGERAERYAPALAGGVAMASTRYRFGDDFTPAQYAEAADLPFNEAGAAFAAAMSGHGLCAVPARSITAPAAATVGLGDTFVGGFLGALARGALAREGATVWT